MAGSRLIRGVVPDKELQARIIESVRIRGVTETAKILGLSYAPILRIIGGQPCYPGTLALAKMGLDAIANREGV